MPAFLFIAFFLGCMIVERITKKRILGNNQEQSRDANGQERTTGKLVFGEHWQAWADAISREAIEPWEEQAA